MKTFADEIIALSYKGAEINDLISRYRKTRKKRIKDKIFKKILPLSMNEKQVIILSDVVLMKYNIYEETLMTINDLEKRKRELEEELNKLEN